MESGQSSHFSDAPESGVDEAAGAESMMLRRFYPLRRMNLVQHRIPN
jgi:hypothetical protein